MLKSYDILTRCQLELKGSKCQTIDKLQLEMYLRRVKLIMLDNGLSDEINCRANIEQQTKKVYEEICHLSCLGGKAHDVSGIVMRLQNLMEGMKRPLKEAEME